jgi:hypothetical protein
VGCAVVVLLYGVGHRRAFHRIGDYDILVESIKEEVYHGQQGQKERQEAQGRR